MSQDLDGAWGHVSSRHRRFISEHALTSLLSNRRYLP